MREFVRKYQGIFVDMIGSIDYTDGSGKTGRVDDGIEASCLLIEEQSQRNGKVVFIGNGGSAAISSHMSIDFWKNGNIPCMSFNDGAMLTCLGNDYGYDRVFEKPIEMFMKKEDVLIAISSSGRSPNILNGVHAAAKIGSPVITLSGFDGDNPLRSMGSLNFYVPANKYGFVEIIHQYICHWILDSILYSRSIYK
jgi:D-sedoheptulose 7-phosphate isomerase